MSDLSWMRPRLAELVGWTYKPDAIVPFYQHPCGEGMSTELWRPDEDVAQAVRCMSELRLAGRIDFCPGHDLRTWRVLFEPRHFGESASLARAICLAIAAALGWDAPPAREGDAGE